jgi:predicted nucleotidyltransferase
MADPILPPDFGEFLRLLNAHRVDYLIVGGYAVAFHGHPRATADIDIWIPMREETAQQLVTVLKAFGFDVPQLSTELFLRPDQVIRLGTPPLRIELLTTIAGVDFDACHARAVHTTLDGVDVRLIALDDLKENKRAAGRHQDLADLDHLP